MLKWFSKARWDSWFSATLGLGGSKDTTWVQDNGPLDAQSAMTLYHANDLARLLCDLPVDFGTRSGWCIKGLDSEVQRLDLRTKIAECAAFGRAAGGAALYLTMRDGGMPAQPVRPTSEGLAGVMVLDRRQLVIKQWDNDPASPRYGEPLLYDVAPVQGGGLQTVHASRLIVLGGDRTAPLEKWSNAGWDYSVLTRAYPVLQQYGLSWESAAQLLNTMSQAVYGVKDLAEILASDEGESRLIQRMTMIQKGRSTARAMVRDAEGESFEILSTSLGGLPELMDRFAVRLAAAYRIPVTVLMGQAPAGLNATGASDLQIFWASIRSWQTDVLKPALYLLGRAMAPGREPCITIEDPDPLWRERNADFWLKRSQADVGYVNAQVYRPEEVAKERQDYIKVNLLERELLKEEESNASDPAQEPGAGNGQAGESVDPAAQDGSSGAAPDAQS